MTKHEHILKCLSTKPWRCMGMWWQRSTQ